MRRNRERHGFGTDAEWENLAGDDPCYRSPSRRKRSYVNANEGDDRALWGEVVDRGRHAEDGHEEGADAHDNSAT